jgi:hypothetical protein
MIIYRVLRNITHGLKQAARRFVEAHIVQNDPCTSELAPDELEAMLRDGGIGPGMKYWPRVSAYAKSKTNI